jgi:glycine C-acetyltransferase
MDGDIAPLDKLCAKWPRSTALILMVDDAHGEGVLGAAGAASSIISGCTVASHVEVGTLSKAFGVVGGLVAGRKPIIDWLRQRGRPFLFSSAMTAPDVAACIEA